MQGPTAWYGASVAIDPTAAAGFSAGAGAYERARPAYPAEAVRWVIERLRIGPASRVLDLGAGTGKFTALLLPVVGTVIALEPVAAMRDELKRSMPATVLAGTAEAIPLADSSVDGVVSAQAFHWFDGRRALREIRRIVRAGGGLALVWNVRDRSVDWVAGLSRIVDAYGGAIRRHETEEWKSAFATPIGFSSLERADFPNGQTVDEDQVVDRVASTSFIAMLADAERRGVLDRVRALVRSHPDTRGRRSFTFPHSTRVYTCTRL